ALSGQKHQNVAGPVSAALGYAVHHGVDQITLLIGIRTPPSAFAIGPGRILQYGPIKDVHRVKTTGHLDNRSQLTIDREMLSEPIRVDRGGRNYQLQVAAPRQQLQKESQQKIDIQAALVRFINDDG